MSCARISCTIWQHTLHTDAAVLQQQHCHQHQQPRPHRSPKQYQYVAAATPQRQHHNSSIDINASQVNSSSNAANSGGGGGGSSSSSSSSRKSTSGSLVEISYYKITVNLHLAPAIPGTAVCYLRYRIGVRVHREGSRSYVRVGLCSPRGYKTLGNRVQLRFVYVRTAAKVHY